MVSLQPLRPPGGRRVIEPPGLGASLDTGALEPLASLHELRDVVWALYEQDGAWRLHVSSGFEVQLNGRRTGGGALQTGDVLEADGRLFRFVAAEWPGLFHAGLDERTAQAPHDDALAVVYRDWALEHGSPIAETLRRPVTREEQARQVPFFASSIAEGAVEAGFAGRFVTRLVSRRPTLDLEDFVDRLAHTAPLAPRLDTVRAVGISSDDSGQLALLLARHPALSQLLRLEVGGRGVFHLEDFRLDAPPAEAHLRHLPRAGPARALQLELVSWDGWTSVEPLTRDGRFVLREAVSLVPLEEGAALVTGEAGPVVFHRAEDWVLDVRPSVSARLHPTWAGLPLQGSLGLVPGDVFELVPGVVCRLTPALVGA